MTKVMVTYPHANTVAHNFHISMMEMDRKYVTEVIPTRGYPGTGLIIARNVAVTNFLRSDNEWLWTLDTDIGFEPDTLDRLLDSHKLLGAKVISGLYSTVLETGARYLDGSHSYKEYPLALRRNEHGFSTYESYEGAMEVNAVGAGCLLVHRTVFEAIGEDGWYDTVYGLGEDISFCVKAREAGFKIICDTTVKCSHYKSVWLRG